MPFSLNSVRFNRRQAKSSSEVLSWYGGGLLAIFLVSLMLRLWGLSRFNTLVFDEVYYANFAAAFLRGEQQFGGHPPLSTYFIAGGIWLAQKFGWGDPAISNALTGTQLTTFSYRWLNAVTGSFIPLVVGAIAFQLTRRRSYGLIAALLSAADGMFLVESRYALNNIYLVLFGLLGHWFLLRVLQIQGRRQPGERYGAAPFWVDLTLAGIALGASIAIKWNGAGFLLGAYLLWGVGWAVQWLRRLRRGQGEELGKLRDRHPLANLTRLNVVHMVYGFALVPALTYSLIWIPYMQLDPSTSFWGWQAKVLDYHHRVGGMDAHPYCSPWYSWLLMVRPIAYFYETVQAGGKIPTETGLSLPEGSSQAIYDVHAMGNPILWWLSSAAILLLVWVLGSQIWHWLRGVRATNADQLAAQDADFYPANLVPNNSFYNWTAAFLVVNWFANWLPWVNVTRCVFLYHYMGSSVFSLLAIALLLDLSFRSAKRDDRMVAIALISLILAAFLFWMPLYLGLPMSPLGIQLRRWLPSWI